MKEETVNQAERITKELERYVAEDNRSFVLGVLLRELTTKESPEFSEGAIRIDLPSLKRALEVLREHRGLILNAISVGGGAFAALDDIEHALAAIVDDDWRPT